MKEQWLWDVPHSYVVRQEGMQSSKTMLKHSMEYDSKFLAIRTDSQVIGELLSNWWITEKKEFLSFREN